MKLPCTIDEILINALKNYPNCNRIVFGSKLTYKPKPKTIKMLVIMLIASEIIMYDIHYRNDDESKVDPIVTAVLSVDIDGNLNLYQFSYWDCIKYHGNQKVMLYKGLHTTTGTGTTIFNGFHLIYWHLLVFLFFANSVFKILIAPL